MSNDPKMLVEIHTDVKWIKAEITQHVEEDRQMRKDFILPLWNDHQQRKGARWAAAIGAMIINVLVAGVTAWASVKAMAVGIVK